MPTFTRFGLTSLCINLLFCLTGVNGHFRLNYPATMGFNEDTEPNGPCGTSINLSNITNWHVDGDAISLTSTHPAANWLFRATLDTTASGNWTELLPILGQSGLGAFCETGVKAPDSWAGRQGIIQVVQDAADGQLFQCGAVNFVAGASPSLPSVCTNATGVTASPTSDTALAALVSATGSTSGSGAASSAPASTTQASTSSATGSAASASATKSSAVSMTGNNVFGSFFWGMVVVFGCSTFAIAL